MAEVDMPLAQLADYTADLRVPDDFDEFWRQTIAEAQRHDLALAVQPYSTPWQLIDTYDVTFAGFGGAPIKAWLSVPAGTTGRLPTVISFLGYSGGRGFPQHHNLWAQAGYAHLVMDSRGQGFSDGGPTDPTPDADLAAGLSRVPGMMTAGIDDPQHYFYRRLYTDVARMIEAATKIEFVDPDALVVTGVSQGGGLTLAAAGLAPLLGIELKAAAPDVPFLCAFPRALQITDSNPYAEITRYLAVWRGKAEQAYKTLSYFDAALLAQQATAPALFSVALMDSVCPPSTVYAAYNRYGTRSGEIAKEIKVYSHNGHEGGSGYQQLVQAEFFAKHLRG